MRPPIFGGARKSICNPRSLCYDISLYVRHHHRKRLSQFIAPHQRLSYFTARNIVCTIHLYDNHHSPLSYQTEHGMHARGEVLADMKGHVMLIMLISWPGKTRTRARCRQPRGHCRLGESNICSAMHKYTSSLYTSRVAQVAPFILISSAVPPLTRSTHYGRLSLIQV